MGKYKRIVALLLILTLLLPVAFADTEVVYDDEKFNTENNISKYKWLRGTPLVYEENNGMVQNLFYVTPSTRVQIVNKDNKGIADGLKATATIVGVAAGGAAAFYVGGPAALNVIFSIAVPLVKPAAGAAVANKVLGDVRAQIDNNTFAKGLTKDNNKSKITVNSEAGFTNKTIIEVTVETTGNTTLPQGCGSRDEILSFVKYQGLLTALGVINNFDSGSAVGKELLNKEINIIITAEYGEAKEMTVVTDTNSDLNNPWNSVVTSRAVPKISYSIEYKTTHNPDADTRLDNLKKILFTELGVTTGEILANMVTAGSNSNIATNSHFSKFVDEFKNQYASFYEGGIKHLKNSQIQGYNRNLTKFLENIEETTKNLEKLSTIIGTASTVQQANFVLNALSSELGKRVFEKEQSSYSAIAQALQYVEIKDVEEDESMEKLYNDYINNPSKDTGDNKNLSNGVRLALLSSNNEKVQSNKETYKTALYKELSTNNVSSNAEMEAATYVTNITNKISKYGQNKEALARSTLGARVRYYIIMSKSDKGTTLNKEIAGISPISTTNFSQISIPKDVTNLEAYSNLLKCLQEAMWVSLAKGYTPDGFFNTIKGNSSLLISWGDLLGSVQDIVSATDKILDDTLYFKLLKEYWTEGGLLTLYQKVISSDGYIAGAESELAVSSENPIKIFVTDDNKISNNIAKGIAISATWKPLKSSTFDPMSWRVLAGDEAFIQKFNPKFGYQRKLLYIDSNRDAATSYFIEGSRGNLRIAKLKDVLTKESDVVLWIDERYYNKEKIQEVLKDSIKVIESKDKPETTVEKVQNAWDSTTATIGSAIDKFMDSPFSFTWSTLESIGTEEESKESQLSKIMMSTDRIVNTFNDTEVSYDENRGFAFISAALRRSLLKKNLFDTKQEPVFIGSKDLYKIIKKEETVPLSAYNAIFNYALLQNIRDEVGVSYLAAMDWESPIYMDIYGNILTESGVVVIPAAANGTLMDKPYDYKTVAFLTSYGKKYKMPYEAVTGIRAVHKGIPLSLEDYFYESEENRDGLPKAEIKNIAVDGLDLARSGSIAPRTQKLLYDLQMTSILEGGEIRDYFFIRMVINEVLKGATLEKVNDKGTRESKPGIITAYNYEQMRNNLGLKEMRTSIAIPNLMFNEDFASFLSILILIATVLGIGIVMIWGIFIPGLSGSLSFKGAVTTWGSVILVVGLIVALPVITDASYYKINKMILNDEALAIASINLEKRDISKEVSMTALGTTDDSSKLYLLVDNLPFNMGNILVEYFLDPTGGSIKERYERRWQTHPLYGSESIHFVDNKIYLDAQDLFDSARVKFDSNNFQLEVVGSQASASKASFFTAYYMYLEKITEAINKYNNLNGLFECSTATYDGSKIVTLGLSNAFFKSTEFLEDDKDIFGLFELYDLSDSLDLLNLNYKPVVSEGSEVTTEEITLSKLDVWRNSNWVRMNYTDPEKVLNNIFDINKYAREYVIKNHASIGKISDENFIKSMALAMAMKHNKVMSIKGCDSLEIFSLNPEDLIRLSVSKKDVALQGSSYSYSRYIFEKSSIIGVVGATVLDAVLLVENAVKPVANILIMVLAFTSIIIMQIMMGMHSKAAQGMSKALVLLIVMNILHASVLKIGTWLPLLIPYEALNLIILAILHLLSLGGYYWLLWSIVTDYANMGNQKINETFTNVMKVGKMDLAFSGNTQPGTFYSKEEARGILSDLRQKEAERERRKRDL